MKNLYNHVDLMNTNDMPRDFLARLVRHFIQQEGDRSVFQQKHMESCLELTEHFPTMGKRKISGNALPLTLFKLVQVEVEESGDELAKKYFVEAFRDRNHFLNIVVKELEECVLLEERMSNGARMTLPEFLADENLEDAEERQDYLDRNGRFDIDALVQRACDLLEGKSTIEVTKLMKAFDINQKIAIGIHHPGLRKEATTQSVQLPKIPTPKNYPPNVTSGVQMFTKPTALGVTGKANVVTRVCILVEVRHLKVETQERSQKLLNFDMPDHTNSISNTEEEEEVFDGLTQSQDYPGFFQSQTQETILHCNLCEFSTRQKVEIEEHLSTHPKCTICGDAFPSEHNLLSHVQAKHVVRTMTCDVCHKDILSEDIAAHKKKS